MVVAAHIAYGQRGEELAAQWYRRNGYTVVARNWRCAIGEIDLLARRGATLVVCEVKTRRSDAFGVPALAVGPPSSSACAGWPRRGWRAPRRAPRGRALRRRRRDRRVVDVYENAF